MSRKLRRLMIIVATLALATTLATPVSARVPIADLDQGSPADKLQEATATVVVPTPGHTADHLCFLAGGMLFSGDHIMGGSTVVIEDLAAYLDSLRLLQTLDLTRIYPGHGPVIEDPQAEIAAYISHRLDRERQSAAASTRSQDGRSRCRSARPLARRARLGALAPGR